MAQPPAVSPPPFAPPPPPRPYAANWSLQRTPAGMALVVGVLVVFVLFAFVAFTGVAFGGGFFPFALFAPFCGFLFIVILLIVLAASTQGPRRLPPPPPIQQPMVPAGMQGPVALNCPNCGAPPSNVDRFGVATCTYCNTRFLVR